MIHITKLGKGDPIVFFHGWGFSHTIWESLTSELGDDYELYLVDLPGYGASKFCNWLDFKSALLNQLPQQFSLIGWSMGGLYATRLAIEEQGRVSHLLNVASSPKFITTDRWPGITREVFLSFYDNLSKHPEKTVRQFINLQLKGLSIKPTINLNAMPSGKTLQYGLEILMNWDLLNQMEGLTIPVMYLFGQLDSIVPAQTGLALRKELYDVHIETFKQSAHMPFLSQKSEFIDLLKDFIK